MTATEKIKHCDDHLKLLREGWVDAKDEKKAFWMTKIDAALDERVELMKERDATK